MHHAQLAVWDESKTYSLKNSCPKTPGFYRSNRTIPYPSRTIFSLALQLCPVSRPRFWNPWKRCQRLQHHLLCNRNMFQRSWQHGLVVMMERVLLMTMMIAHPPKKKPKSRRQNGAPKEKSEPKVPKETGWDYSVVRKKFLAARKAEGKKYVEAVKLWDESMEKANYLGPCSVGELKKRRFLPPGSTDNPWFKKIHGPTNWVGFLSW